MKKRYFLSVILFVTAIVVRDRFIEQEIVINDSQPGRTSPAKGPVALKTEITRTETLKSIAQDSSTVAVPELSQARAHFRENLKNLRKITSEYNKKVLENRLSEQDEASYQVAVSETKMALQLYELSVKANQKNQEIQ